ncbi:hypothetical protein DMH08_27750 [Actinomadura sp. WAC 06369]|nr:hypothetical protein DMH08_27750 [Actinomadura sp. WAC 06369]
MLDEFIQDLSRFKKACCVPSDRELVRMSHTVYDEQHKKTPVLRRLSTTAVSNVQTRQRQDAPGWGWLATYILTCLYFHRRSGTTTLDFDGPTDLDSWYKRYQAVCRHLAQARIQVAARSTAEAPQDPDLEADAASTLDPLGREPHLGPRKVLDGPVSAPPPAPPGPPPPPPPALPSQVPHWRDLQDSALEGWMEQLRHQQSQAHRRHYALFGQYGVELLIRAENGDHEAACRLGILLLCHDRPAEGQAWLMSAAAQGDESAEILLSTVPSRQREMAAELAYEFTLPGYVQDRVQGRSVEVIPTGAEVYYRAATTAGHLGAAIRLGLIFEARGDLDSALLIFARAADRCHPDAIDHFERLNTHLHREQNRRDLGEPFPEL